MMSGSLMISFASETLRRFLRSESAQDDVNRPIARSETPIVFCNPEFDVRHASLNRNHTHVSRFERDQLKSFMLRPPRIR
jgi:hypothetical protein